MKKISLQIVIVVVGILGFTLSLYAAQFNDLSRSLKDSERSMRQFRQQQGQLKFRTDMKGIDKQTFASEDRAAKKNQELLDKMIADQNRDLGEEMDDWLEKFAKEYRMIIEVTLIALAISGLSIFFYTRKLKKIAKEKEKELEQARRDRHYRK